MDEELWFRVKCGLRGSDGAGVLERRLGDPRAYTYVPDLWDWFVQKHPEGQVLGPDAAWLIARGSGWQGDADAFCAAMVAAGFLAVVPEGFRVKGWAEWAGYHLTVRAASRDRKRKSRGPASDVTVTSQGHGQEKQASEVVGHSDPSLISSLSVSREGVQGKGSVRRRTGLASPYSDGQDPYPLTSAVLAALWERGITRPAPPAAKSAARVEAAIAAAGLDQAVDRLAAIYADPAAQEPLTYHVAAIGGARRVRPTYGDLGAELHPWTTRLTPEQKAKARSELAALHPDLSDAPLGISGVPGVHPVEAIAELNERWRRVAEASA